MTSTDQRTSARPLPATSRGIRGLTSDLALGARLAVGAGRASWIRLGLMAFALGACVLLLLMAATIGPATGSRQARASALQPTTVYEAHAATDMYGAPAADTPTMEVHREELNSGPNLAIGYSIAALTVRATPPPGVAALPGPGQLVISPALADLLASEQGAGLRPRLADRVIGTIGPAGLPAPRSLLFYRGIAPSAGPLSDATSAVGWGTNPALSTPDQGFSDVDKAVVVTGIAILVVPLLVFISIASRIGGPARIRRLAAIRLVGATAIQVRRFAAAEAMIAGVAGLAVGAGGYLLLRAFAGSLSLGGAGFFAADLVPDPMLAALIVVLVPALAVVSVSAGQRRAAVEPLGVRRSGRQTPRRWWWRMLLVLFAGAALLVASKGSGQIGGGDSLAVRFVPGVALAMICVPVLAPYLVEKLSRILPTSGIGWQLAVRGVRADSGTAARSVSGLAVVLCAAVTLLPLLAYTGARVGENTESAGPAGDGNSYLFIHAAVGELPTIQHRAQAEAGTARVAAWSMLDASLSPGSDLPVAIADCAALRQLSTLTGCRDGDVVRVVGDVPGSPPEPGSQLTFAGSDGDLGSDQALTLSLPDTIRSAAATTDGISRLYLTPGALIPAAPALLRDDAWLRVAIDTRGMDDAGFDRVRNSLAGYGWQVDDSMFGVGGGLTHLGQLMTTARTGLLIGGALILLVAVLSMLVLAVEQITERRRALTMAVASGVPRSVLARASVLGALLPAAVAVLVADAIGIGITFALNPLLRTDLRLNPMGLLGLSVATLALVAAINAATLPALRRLTRPSALRTE
ncbi:ABC transporter permease family protein [Nakamurella lactea]|uniref:hypothetical protein n=1 Tax=Nakamurella lactea TaxID=459515 RepID=UPI00048AE371|nr:hypothetical protein [Nakamurella lactea]